MVDGGVDGGADGWAVGAELRDASGRRIEPDSPLALRGHRTNLVGIPAQILSTTAFNEAPRALRIHGTRGQHAALFEALDESADADAAAEVFQRYLARTFGLNPDFSGSEGADGRRRFRASYLRLLKGWMFDANNAEGAVLKGWVESRFGLLPTFHGMPIRRFASTAWYRYGEQKASTRFHNNHIHLQLDLLYEYCQWWMRRGWPGAPMPAGTQAMRLYRGVNDFEEHFILERPDRRTAVLRLNNLSSFSVDREIAGQFGDYILEAWVPAVKIVFFRDILPRYPFQGEGEYLVVGGDYRVTVSLL
ncbi:NAD(+)--dinitrogen-reductase ADP-D-ribosyltransferase [Azospirillum sp. ST 5-10]|uniref:NAD(+)--dinitrogen-reductase ADP-D-ribosyltransferase n=1 Tax=unclassified Azospirillum TaxID=2630922 RepID=UPI003F4A1328